MKHIVKSNFVSMQVVNISAYIQSQISTISAQSGFYKGHMAVSDVYGGTIKECDHFIIVLFLTVI